MILNILKYSAKNTIRNKFLTFTTIIVLTLLLFFINVLLVLNSISGKIIGDVNSKMSISLYLKEGFGKNSVEVTTLEKNIRDVSENIVFVFKDKEQILIEMKQKDPDAAKILESENLLPETIILSNIDLKEYVNVNKTIENQLSIFEHNEIDKDYFANYTTQYKRIEQVTYFLDSWGIGMIVVIFTFTITILVIIYSVIGNFVYYYRNEIYITRLVGGSRFFIYGPFILQGIIFSLVSLIISFVFFSILLNQLKIIYPDLISSFKIETVYLFFEILILIFIGAGSGYFSSRKYLKQLK